MDKVFKLHIMKMKDHEEIILIRFIGEIDMTNSMKIKTAVDKIINNNQFYLIGDLRKLRFIDSTGCLNLISITMKTRKQGGFFKLFGALYNIKRIFNEIGLNRIVNVYDTFEDAFDSALAEIREGS